MSEMEKTILDLKSQLQFKVCILLVCLLVEKFVDNFVLSCKLQEMSSMQLQKSKLNCTQPTESTVRNTSEAYLNESEKFNLPNKSCVPVQGKEN